jgi:hypothetical protein
MRSSNPSRRGWLAFLIALALASGGWLLRPTEAPLPTLAHATPEAEAGHAPHPADDLQPLPPRRHAAPPRPRAPARDVLADWR